MTRRTRLLALAAIGVVAIGVAGGAVVFGRVQNTRADARATPVATGTSLPDGPRIVFRNTARGPHYGEVAVVPLADPTGPRTMTGRSCDRVFATGRDSVCLASKAGLVTTYTATVLDASLAHEERALPLTGIPSRARLSGDGAYAATTSFVAGDSYAATNFSTRTVISAVDPSGETSSSMDLEDFTLVDHGRVIAPVDRNYWGVTFTAESAVFYVTVKFGGVTHLARGDTTTRRITTLTTDAECPSVSPDGRTIVYKHRGSAPAGQWRLVRYDVATGVVTPLTETRSVDDQVEWLDDDHVLYGLPRTGADAAVTDVWKVATDAATPPQLFLPQAWSPAVVDR